MNANQAQEKAMASSSLVLIGPCDYQVDEDRVLISIDKIENQREAGNVSGTLSIELWGLSAPYTGSDYGGETLACTSIGEIYGQYFLADCRYDLLFHQPPEGRWYVTLMLREWTENGYITRDYVNYETPLEVSAEEPEAEPVPLDTLDEVASESLAEVEEQTMTPASTETDQAKTGCSILTKIARFFGL